MEPQLAAITLYVQVQHVSGDVQPTDHVLEHWLLDQLESKPKLATVKTDEEVGDKGETRVASKYRILYDGHRLAEPVDGASPDLRGYGRFTR
jgi:hypothetical protein